MFIVDCFGKHTLSILYYKPIDTKETAQLYIQYVYHIYRPLLTIVSDCGLQFISIFWREFTSILDIKLKLLTVYHLQTDRQTEIANQILDQQLQPFVNYFQDDWTDLLLILDYVNANLKHSSTGFVLIELELGYLLCTNFD
jgi:hypothetical protein